MILTFDGSKRLVVFRDPEGLHLYVEEGDPNQIVDKVYSRNLQYEQIKPLVELHFPKEVSFKLVITTLLTFASIEELGDILREVLKLNHYKRSTY